MQQLSHERGYRAEIDGLRAVAVLAILFFHLDEHWLPGGFVGVDVFFVISGFLITSRLAREVETGTFSFSSFYVRRARRLVPALLVTLLLTFIAAYLVLIPQSFASFGHDAIASTFSVANIKYWLTLSYFDEEAGLSPLLHTWSLSVEEQFYLVWPLLIWLIGRRRSVLHGSLVAVCIASFAWGLYQVGSDPSGAFFLMPSRMWEFGLGAGLALLPALAAPAWVREALQGLGLIGIVTSVLRFHSAMSFPGWVAALPCISTAAVIWAGETTWVAHVLSNRVALWIGKVSYSVYLIHWPIIVFAKQLTLVGLTTLDLLLIASITFALAWLMFVQVEQRFRQPRAVSNSASPNRRFVIGCAAGAFALACAGVYVERHAGLPGRYPAAFARLLTSGDRISKEDAITWRVGKCFLGGSYGKGQTPRDFDRKTCLKLHPRKPNVLLIGDSVAAHLYSGLAAELGRKVNFLQVTVASCRGKAAASGKGTCGLLMKDMLQKWLPKHTKDIDAVLFATRWDRPNALSWAETFVKRVTDLGVPIVVVGTQVSFRTPPVILVGSMCGPLRTWLSGARDGKLQLHVPRTDLETGIEPIDAALAEIVSRYPNAHFLAPSAIQCRDGVCAVSSDEGHGPEFLYRDKVHFSPTGSRWFARQLSVAQVLGKPAG